MREELDLGEVKTFYEPVDKPFIMEIPVPKEIISIAGEVNGKTMTIRKAVEEIKAAGIGEVSVTKDCLMLEMAVPVGIMAQKLEEEAERNSIDLGIFFDMTSGELKERRADSIDAAVLARELRDLGEDATIESTIRVIRFKNPVN